MLEKIGHYQICRKIGAGGMGVVYEGWDERLGRAVAIFRPFTSILPIQKRLAACGVKLGRYYTGRQLALIGEVERSVKVLSGVIEGGFLCGSALRRDSSFASLRSSPAFSELICLAEARRTQVHDAFLEAGGPEILNLAVAAL